MMKKITFLLMAAFSFVLLNGCSDDKNEDDVVNYAKVIAGNYSGYTSATNGAGYFIDMITENEGLVITANEDGTANLVLTSSQWGTFSSERVTVKSTSGGYTVSGSGATELSAHESSETSSYQFTFTGTIVSLNDAELVFDFPALMTNGTIITFKTGSAPEIPEDGLAEAVAGIYNGYILATNGMGMFTDMLSEDVVVSITANEDGTADLQLVSSEWGTFNLVDMESKN
ncbi:MAG: hypothetical protein LUF90_02445 [Rikenellaceae bacterium]|nr:hypothetical protein [Rikenellaceae bacterium]